MIHSTITSWLLLLLLSSSAWASSTPSSSRRPSFVQHVDADLLSRARAVAEDRHRTAVQQALANYPTHQVKVTSDDDDDSLDKITFQDYAIDAPGALPDFVDILPRAIAVVDLFTPEECAQVIQMAEDHYAKTNNGEWKVLRSGQYPVTGFWIKEIPAVYEWFVQTCAQRLFPILAKKFPDFCREAAQLCVDSAYLFKYTPETGRRTDIHTDSGCLSFTIALNDGFTGGGTWFEGLEGNVLAMKTGQVTVRPGGLKHAGFAVESGERYIIGGFCMHQEKPELVRQLLQDTEQRDLLEAALVYNPEYEGTYNLLASALEKEEKPAQAQQVLEYCRDNVHDGSGSVAYPLGCLYMAADEFDKTVECMKVCLQADETDVPAMNLLAEAWDRIGGHESDQETLYHRLVQTPEATETEKSVAFTNLGVLHEGKDAEVHFYKKALEMAPTRFAPRYSLGSAYASRKQWSKALNAFRESIPLAESPEYEKKALEACYRTAALFLQHDKSKPRPTTREETMARFGELMGAENLDRLVTLRS